MSIINKYLDTIVSVGSSSEGNAYYLRFNLRSGKKFGLLIECGFKYSKLLERFWEQGVNLDQDVDACLISHEHNDHAIGIERMLAVGIPCYAPPSVFEKHNVKPLDEKHVFDKEYTYKYIYADNGDFIKVFGLPLEHYDEKDNKVYNMGYVININGVFQLLYVIDTKYIKQDLTKFKFKMIMIEANYISRNAHIALDKAKKESDIGNVVRYNRLFASHLSLENTANILFGKKDNKGNWLIKPFDLSECEWIILTHLSSNYGTNYQYYLSHMEKRKPKHVKVSVTLRNGGII